MRAVAAILILGLTLVLSACASGPAPGSAEALRAANAQAIAYRLGTGDKLHIAVFGADKFSGDYTVAPDGNIALPLVGNVHAAGLTIPQLHKAVVALLGNGYVKDPRVTIVASDLRPYYILGEVNKPGRYSYMPDLTVMDAVATAQGFTYRADMSTIYIRHARQPSEKEYPLTSTTMVEPGDTIRVTQRYF